MDGWLRCWLPPATYVGGFADCHGAPGTDAAQYAPGVTDVNSGHQYVLRAGQSVTGVDAKLQPGASISGHITAAGDTHPLHGVCVDATTSGPARERPPLADSGPAACWAAGAARSSSFVAACDCCTRVARVRPGRPASRRQRLDEPHDPSQVMPCPRRRARLACRAPGRAGDRRARGAHRSTDRRVAGFTFTSG